MESKSIIESLDRVDIKSILESLDMESIYGRCDPPPARRQIDARFASLAGADLRCMNLRKVDLFYADLRNQSGTYDPGGVGG